MRRLFAPLLAPISSGLVVALAVLVTAGPLAAKSHSFKLHREATLNGTKLSPGTYTLELNGQGEARIYRNGEMLVKARVEVKPLANGNSGGTVLQAADGSPREIRLKKEVVVFVR